MLGDILKPSHKHQTPAEVSSINLRKGKVQRKHSLHGKNSSLSFIEAVYQWKKCHSIDAS